MLTTTWMRFASTSGGFRLAALHRSAIDDSRVRLKPEIPEAVSRKWLPGYLNKLAWR